MRVQPPHLPDHLQLSRPNYRGSLSYTSVHSKGTASLRNNIVIFAQVEDNIISDHTGLCSEIKCSLVEAIILLKADGIKLLRD